MIWRQRNGAKWRAVPSKLGPWWRAAQLHIRWSRTGIWERAFAILRDAGQPELGEVFLDGTNVRAHHKSGDAHPFVIGSHLPVAVCGNRQCATGRSDTGCQLAAD